MVSPLVMPRGVLTQKVCVSTALGSGPWSSNFYEGRQTGKIASRNSTVAYDGRGSEPSRLSDADGIGEVLFGTIMP